MSATLIEPDLRQRADALAGAERVRLKRARFRGDIRRQTNPEARGILADAIEQMPDWLETVDVCKLIEFAPRVGSVLVERLLEGVEVRSHRRLRDLSERQRRLLADGLRSIGQ